MTLWYVYNPFFLLIPSARRIEHWVCEIGAKLDKAQIARHFRNLWERLKRVSLWVSERKITGHYLWDNNPYCYALLAYFGVVAGLNVLILKWTGSFINAVYLKQQYILWGLSVTVLIAQDHWVLYFIGNLKVVLYVRCNNLFSNSDQLWFIGCEINGAILRYNLWIELFYSPLIL